MDPPLSQPLNVRLTMKTVNPKGHDPHNIFKRPKYHGKSTLNSFPPNKAQTERDTHDRWAHNINNKTIKKPFFLFSKPY